MNHRIAVLEGDGVGPEVVAEAVKVLKATGSRFGFALDFHYAPVGRGAWRKFGHSCPADTVALCAQSDAVLFGAVGGPDDEAPPPMGNGIVYLRRELHISCNFRPIKLYKPLIDVGPIKKEAKQNGVDFVIVRAIGNPGAYGPGEEKRVGRSRVATSLFSFSDGEVQHALKPAFELARSRRKRIHLVGYAQVINASKIWKTVFHEVSALYPDVECFDMLPDNCNQSVARDPSQFDVLVFDDLFRAGMVVDLGAVLIGSMGMSPSAEMRPNLDADGNVMPSLKRVFGLYEPSHGTANRRAGQNIINPIATILSARDLLRYSLDQPEAADAIDRAVEQVLVLYRTYDIVEPGTTKISCSGMGDRIADAVKSAGS